MITEEQLAYLERRYAPAADQRCRVCGAPLVLSAERAWDVPGPRYNCSSDDAHALRSSRTVHESIAHYEESTWYDDGRADPVVVALARAYRELEPRAGRPRLDAAAEQRLRADGAGGEDARA